MKVPLSEEIKDSIRHYESSLTAAVDRKIAVALLPPQENM